MNCIFISVEAEQIEVFDTITLLKEKHITIVSSIVSDILKVIVVSSINDPLTDFINRR